MELINREKLARRMAAQGVSQRELAKVAGWKTHSYLGRLLKGEVKTLNTDPALRIAHYLHLDVDDVFVTRVAPVERHAALTRRSPRSSSKAAA